MRRRPFVCILHRTNPTFAHIVLFQRLHFHILLTQHCIPLALIQLHISTFTSQVFRTGRTKGGIFRDGQAGGGDWPPVLRLQLGQCDRGRQLTSGDTTAERKGSSGTVKQAIDNSSEPRRSLLLSTSVLVTRSHIISVTRSLGVPLPRPRGVPESHCLDHAESRSPMVPVTRSPLLSTSVLVTRSHHSLSHAESLAESHRLGHLESVLSTSVTLTYSLYISKI